MKTKTRSIETIRNHIILGIFAISFLWFWAGIFIQFLFLGLPLIILAGIVEYVWVSAIDNELEKIRQNKR